jgi:hypothetical protein
MPTCAASEQGELPAQVHSGRGAATPGRRDANGTTLLVHTGDHRFWRRPAPIPQDRAGTRLENAESSKPKAEVRMNRGDTTHQDSRERPKRAGLLNPRFQQEATEATEVCPSLTESSRSRVPRTSNSVASVTSCKRGRTQSPPQRRSGNRATFACFAHFSGNCPPQKLPI